MKVTVNSVRSLAANAGLPAEITERFLDELINYTFVIAARERKHCMKLARAWLYNTDIHKPDILEVLKPTAEEESYDII